MLNRSRTLSHLLLIPLTLILLGPSITVSAQTELLLEFGDAGLQRLTYKDQVLEDVAAYPADALHIGHMKSEDLAGKPLSCPQCGWGENNNGRHWDRDSKTWTYFFDWGEVQLRYVQDGNTLNLVVTEKNSANSAMIFDGATIFPLALHLLQTPSNFSNPTDAQYAFNTTAPSVTLADYGSAELAAVVPDAAKPLYSGFQPAGMASTYTPIISSTAPDGLATFLPHNDRPLAPGQSDSFTVSLRFAASGTPLLSLASDVYRNWASAFPAQVNWPDRRVIGTAYLARSPQGPVHQPGGYVNNPRRYFGESDSARFDVTNPEGLKKFQSRVLLQSAAMVQNMHRLNAQGAITWDIEGQQYPQDTSYVCAPDQLSQIAPEMESVISEPGSLYAGMHLVDAYFKIMTSAGFRVGVCVRPQHFTVAADHSAQQVFLPESAIAAEILRKMKYAHDRWGATLFYLDSTVQANGGLLPAEIFEQAARALPDSLLIPEETTPRDYAYGAAFKSFLFHGDLGTDPAVLNYYPKAFSANLINDVDPATLAANQTALTAAVRHGDLLMAFVTYWHPNNDTIFEIYKKAAKPSDEDDDGS